MMKTGTLCLIPAQILWYAILRVSCGGVLEHPSGSYAWNEYQLTRPIKNQWTKSGNGWVCEVWQSAYGHKANKKTWLYYTGKSIPIDPLWDRPVGTHQIGFHDQRGKERNKPTLSKHDANATPILFMEYLIALSSASQ